MDKLQFVYTSDVVPVVHGHWVKEEDRTNHWHCSACGYVVGLAHMAYNYCPKCGAKIDTNLE